MKGAILLHGVVLLEPSHPVAACQPMIAPATDHWGWGTTAALDNGMAIALRAATGPDTVRGL